MRTWKVQIGRSKTATEDCCRWKLASAYTLAVMVGEIKKLGKKGDTLERKRAGDPERCVGVLACGGLHPH